MAIKRHLQLTLRRAEGINACTTTRSRTMVFARVSYKNIVYETSVVEDMGQKPIWDDDGTNVFHFDYENENEHITLELFNRNRTSIGISKLPLAKLAKLLPSDQYPEEKTLPVVVASLSGYQRHCGELVLQAQIKQHQAVGEQGNLRVVLQEGRIDGMTSVKLFKSKTTKMCAKLTYKHVTYRSGILEGMGNKFVWQKENTFSFVINSSEPDDVLEIEIYNGSAKVGECKMLMKFLVKPEEDFRADPSEVVTRTEDLLVKKLPVGSIKVAASFTTPTCRRNSHPQTQPSTSSSTPNYYPPPHSPSTSTTPPPYNTAPHGGAVPPTSSQPTHYSYYAPPPTTQFNAPTESHMQRSASFDGHKSPPGTVYPPEQPTGHMYPDMHGARYGDPLAPSAPVLSPDDHQHHHHRRHPGGSESDPAHSRPAGGQAYVAPPGGREQLRFQGYPEVFNFVENFH